MSDATNNPVNERTYQEVEYLKKNLGPILVAALAEICIRRPADPIEYLGHWLLRWRYNEELKRRDVQNALEVVRQRQWAQTEEESGAVVPAPTAPETFGRGFVPTQPYAPPGYGGPDNELMQDMDNEEVQETFGDLEGDGGITVQPSNITKPSLGSMPSAGATATQRRTSNPQNPENRRTSQDRRGSNDDPAS